MLTWYTNLQWTDCNNEDWSAVKKEFLRRFGYGYNNEKLLANDSLLKEQNTLDEIQQTKPQVNANLKNCISSEKEVVCVSENISISSILSTAPLKSTPSGKTKNHQSKCLPSKEDNHMMERNTATKEKNKFKPSVFNTNFNLSQTRRWIKSMETMFNSKGWNNQQIKIFMLSHLDGYMLTWYTNLQWMNCNNEDWSAVKKEFLRRFGYGYNNEKLLANDSLLKEQNFPREIQQTKTKAKTELKDEQSIDNDIIG